MRNKLVTLGAVVAAIAGGAMLLLRRDRAPKDGHAAPDLASDRDPGASDRAPDSFRPDPTAPLSGADRAAIATPVRPLESAAAATHASDRTQRS